MHSKIGVTELQQKYNFDYWLVQIDYTLDRQLRTSRMFEMVCENDGYRVYKFLPSTK